MACSWGELYLYLYLYLYFYLYLFYLYLYIYLYLYLYLLLMDIVAVYFEERMDHKHTLSNVLSLYS